jgi:hypothetical protein
VKSTTAISGLANLLLIIVLLAVTVPNAAAAHQTPSTIDEVDLLEKAAQAQIPFIENQGQIPNESVAFYVQTFAGTVFVEDGAVLTYNLMGDDGTCTVIRERLSDTPGVTATGIDPSPTKVSYFIGNDPSLWQSGLSTYNALSFGEAYEGIDLSLRAYQNNVEKVFTVQPGACPESIDVSVEGAEALKINGRGQLELDTAQGRVTFTAPVAYQERDGQTVKVEVAYALLDEQSYGFQVGSYDPTLSLIIDPLLASTFVGGSDNEAAKAIAINESWGHVYVAGYTSSSDFLPPG